MIVGLNILRFRNDAKKSNGCKNVINVSINNRLLPLLIETLITFFHLSLFLPSFLNLKMLALQSLFMIRY